MPFFIVVHCLRVTLPQFWWCLTLFRLNLSFVTSPSRIATVIIRAVAKLKFLEGQNSFKSKNFEAKFQKPKKNISFFQNLGSKCYGYYGTDISRNNSNFCFLSFVLKKVYKISCGPFKNVSVMSKFVIYFCQPLSFISFTKNSQTKSG